MPCRWYQKLKLEMLGTGRLSFARASPRSALQGNRQWHGQWATEPIMCWTGISHLGEKQGKASTWDHGFLQELFFSFNVWIFNLQSLIYWSIHYLLCCVNFWFTAKSLRYTHTHLYTCLLITREMQIKTIMRYHLTLVMCPSLNSLQITHGANLRTAALTLPC